MFGASRNTQIGCIGQKSASLAAILPKICARVGTGINPTAVDDSVQDQYPVVKHAHLVGRRSGFES